MKYPSKTNVAKECLVVKILLNGKIKISIITFLEKSDIAILVHAQT